MRGLRMGCLEEVGLESDYDEGELTYRLHSLTTPGDEWRGGQEMESQSWETTNAMLQGGEAASEGGVQW